MHRHACTDAYTQECTPAHTRCTRTHTHTHPPTDSCTFQQDQSPAGLDQSCLPGSPSGSCWLKCWRTRQPTAFRTRLDPAHLLPAAKHLQEHHGARNVGRGYTPYAHPAHQKAVQQDQDFHAGTDRKAAGTPEGTETPGRLSQGVGEGILSTPGMQHWCHREPIGLSPVPSIPGLPGSKVPMPAPQAANPTQHWANNVA